MNEEVKSMNERNSGLVLTGTAEEQEAGKLLSVKGIIARTQQVQMTLRQLM